MHRIHLLLLALALPWMCASCASTQHSAANSPARVKFIDYENNAVIELVNAAHSDRVELYSTPTNQPMRKVADNELMGGLLDYLDDKGFFASASEGLAPASSGNHWIRALEFEGDDRSVHMAIHDASPDEVKIQLYACAKALSQTFNSIYALQSVERADAQTIFDTQNGKSQSR